MLALALGISVCAVSPRPSSSASFSPQYDSEIQAATARFWPNGPDWQWWKAQLYQESRLDPAAVSPVGARGLAQFMPGTWAQVMRELGWRNVSPHSAPHAILAGAYYQAKMDRIWRRNRTVAEAHDLGLASYNAGAGSLLRAQRECGNPSKYTQIVACLPAVTGQANAKQTTEYVTRIARWRALMEAAWSR